MTAGDGVESLEQIANRVCTRYKDLRSQLQVTKEKVIINNEVKLFYDELAMLLEVLTGYEKWINMQEKIAEDILDLNRQMEQCRVSNINAMCNDFLHRIVETSGNKL